MIKKGFLPVILATICCFSPSAFASYWVTNSVLNVPRYAHTATLLPNGQVLIVGGEGAGGQILSSVELYDPFTGSNTLAASLHTARSFHTATLLPNGKVLVAGGVSGFTVISSAELYDPATGIWTVTGSLNTGRFYHTATLLSNGKVLVAGGNNGNFAASATAELYDPAVGTWTATPSMTTNRIWHTATLLTNGLVLVAGGQNGTISPSYLPNAELYDPVANSWRATGSMLLPHLNHTATLMPAGSVTAGRVLVAGGYNGSTTLTTCEVYNPITGTWSLASALNAGRFGHTATLLPNSELLVIGGQVSGGYTNGTESFQVTGHFINTWTLSDSINDPRSGHTATLLPNGQILVVGGKGVDGVPLGAIETYYLGIHNWGWTVVNTNISDNIYGATVMPNGKVLLLGDYNPTIYDPTGGTWTEITITNNNPNNFQTFTSTLLPNGKVYIAQPSLIGPGLMYDPFANTWTNASSFPDILGAPTAILLQNSEVLLVGSAFYFSDVSYSYLYEPGGWYSLSGQLNVVRLYDTTTLLPNGKVLVTGGISTNDTEVFNSYELYDPATGNWTLGTNTMNCYRAFHTATVLPNGKVLVVGYASPAELYDPATGIWQLTGALNTNRGQHSAVLLENGTVMVMGGSDDNGYSLNSTEIYDPATGVWTYGPPMNDVHYGAVTTLLPNGKVLIFGGGSSEAELFDPGLEVSPSRQPQINIAVPDVNLGSALSITGTGLQDISEGSGGNGSQNSTANFPILELYSLQNGETCFLSVTNGRAQTLVTQPVTNFPTGYAMVTAIVNGMPSPSTFATIHPAPGPIHLQQFYLEPNGTAYFYFTNNIGTTYTVLSTTNLSTAINNWTVIGHPNEVGPGNFEFEAPPINNSSRQFFQFRSP